MSDSIKYGVQIIISIFEYYLVFVMVLNMLILIKRFMLSLSASAYVVVVFLIKEGITFSFLPQKLEYISYIIYLMAPVLVAWLCLRLSKHLSVCGMECQIEITAVFNGKKKVISCTVYKKVPKPTVKQLKVKSLILRKLFNSASW